MTSGECSKEPVPLMEGEVPSGFLEGETLAKAGADGVHIVSDGTVHSLVFRWSGLRSDEAVREIWRSAVGNAVEESGPQLSAVPFLVTWRCGHDE